MSAIFPVSSGCARACKRCPTEDPCAGCCGTGRCPSRPVIKQFHQGIVMSGAGLPPHAVGGVVEPLPKCFLYRTWYDFEANQLYVLTTDSAGKANGYEVFDNGDQLLLQYKLSAVENPARLGSVFAGASIVNLQRCLNEQAAVSAGQPRQSVSGTQRVLNCALDKANRGSIGFVYGNPPIPTVLDALTQAAGYVTNPDYWLVPGNIPAMPSPMPANGFMDFGWQVFVRDKSVNRYYRDSFNSPDTLPNFPEYPCDGDLYTGSETFGLVYEFSSTKCRWYLLDGTDAVVAALSAFADPINGGLEPSAGVVALEDNWAQDCAC